MAELVSIYVLIDPVTEEIRYVGKTSRSLGKRLGWHMQDRFPSHKTKWVRKLKSSGLRPHIALVQAVPHTQWPEAERYWVTYYRSLGCPLTNETEGGDNPPSRKGKTISEAHKAAVSRAAKLRWERWRAAGRHTPDSTREKIRAAHLGLKASEESKAKMSAARKGRPHTKERCNNIRQALLGKPKSPEHREKCAESAKKALAKRWGG